MYFASEDFFFDARASSAYSASFFLKPTLLRLLSRLIGVSNFWTFLDDE